MKTFHQVIKEILKDWKRNGYNQDVCDVFTKIQYELKKHKEMCDECIYNNIWKDNPK